MKIEYISDDYFEETGWITCTEDNYLTYEIYPNKRTILKVRLKETDTHLPSPYLEIDLDEKGLVFIEPNLYNKIFLNWANEYSWAHDNEQDIYRGFQLKDVRNEIKDASLNINLISVYSGEKIDADITIHGYLYEFSNKDEAKIFNDYKLEQERNVKIIDDKYVAEVRIYNSVEEEYPDISCNDNSLFDALTWR